MPRHTLVLLTVCVSTVFSVLAIASCGPEGQIETAKPSPNAEKQPTATAKQGTDTAKQAADAATKQAATAKPAAAGTTAPVTPATTSSFVATVGDAGLVRLTWTIAKPPDPLDSWTIVRYADPDDGVRPLQSFTVAPDQNSYVDRTLVTAGLGKSYKYYLFGNSAGQRTDAMKDEKGAALVAPAKFPAQLAATTVFCDPITALDPTLWFALGGSWAAAKGGGFLQSDDKPGNALSVGTKKLLLKKPVNGAGVQITASILISGWTENTVNAADSKRFARIGVGLYTNPTNGSGYFLVFRADPKVSPPAPTSSGIYVSFEDENVKTGSQFAFPWDAKVSSQNGDTGKKLWLKFRLEKTKAGKAYLSGKVWEDGAAEPALPQLTQDNWDWPTDPTNQFLPSLYGGVLGAGTSTVNILFNDICVESLVAPTTAALPASATELASSEPPALDPPSLDRRISIPAIAITESGTTRWGTLFGRVEPDLPLKLPCAKPLCPWEIAGSRPAACCASLSPSTAVGSRWTTQVEGLPSGALTGSGVEFAPGTEFVAPDVAPAVGAPIDGPLLEQPSIELEMDGASDSIPPQFQTSQLPRSNTKDQAVKHSAFHPPDDAPPTGAAPSAPEAPAGGDVASDAKKEKPVPYLELPRTVETTRRALRDFGAIATLPEAAPQQRGDAIDAVILELARRATLDASEMKSIANKIVQQSQTLPRMTDAEAGRFNLATVNRRRIQKLADLALAEKSWSSDVRAAASKRLLSYLDNGIPAELNAVLANKLQAEAEDATNKDDRSRALWNAMASHPATTAARAVPASRYAGPPTDWTLSQGYARPGERRPRDPFLFQPAVHVVPLSPSADGDNSGLNPTSSSDTAFEDLQDSRDGHAKVWTYYFDHPARFPRAKFGVRCCAFEGEGAVIHEGMRVLARQDGRYQVKFNITAPSIPLVLRLQLILFEEPRYDGRIAQSIPRTLTLPPIVVESKGPGTFPSDLEAGAHPTSYLVSVSGYSQVIKEAKADGSQGGQLLLIKRIGTARIGSGVQYQATQ
jgi:hypothetical protein